MTLQVISHALAKAAMFLAAGNLILSTGSSRVHGLTGVSRFLPFSLFSFGLASYLQAYLHQDWRSGIAIENMPGLVTSGPYARSRNPLFLAVILGQMGFFLALPSAFSLLCLIVGVWVIRRQAMAEESALTELYGEHYRQYRQRVPRWL
jgi:protein-S-isoprenylcysteine O-methyltransferase Ste14